MAPDHLELDLQMIGSYDVVAGNQTWALWKSSQRSYSLNHSPPQLGPFFLSLMNFLPQFSQFCYLLKYVIGYKERCKDQYLGGGVRNLVVVPLIKGFKTTKPLCVDHSLCLRNEAFFIH